MKGNNWWILLRIGVFAILMIAGILSAAITGFPIGENADRLWSYLGGGALYFILVMAAFIWWKLTD